MEISIAFQTLVFLKAVLMGVSFGVLYDLLRAVRRSLHAGAAMTAFCDTLFWLGLLGTLFVFVLTAAAGEGRFYVLLGAGLGALLYFIALSPPVLAVAMLLMQGGKRVAGFPVFLWKKTKPHLVYLKNTGKTHKQTKKNLKKPFHFPEKRFKIK